MKKIPTIILGAILLGVVLLNTTCGDKRSLSKVTIEGYLYDSLGGKPINGAWLVLYACESGVQRNQCQSYLVGQAQTDASGHFYIHDDAARSDRYSLIANNYEIGGFNYYCTADWLKEYCSVIYLYKIR